MIIIHADMKVLPEKKRGFSATNPRINQRITSRRR